MADTEPTTTPASDMDGTVLDLRPAADSIKAELVRLGLTYDHGPDPLPDGETWRDYARNIIASIPSQSSDTVTIGDSGTGISKTLTVDELKQVSRIITTKE
jgi:hypothetical protein